MTLHRFVVHQDHREHRNILTLQMYIKTNENMLIVRHRGRNQALKSFLKNLLYELLFAYLLTN